MKKAVNTRSVFLLVRQLANTSQIHQTHYTTAAVDDVQESYRNAKPFSEIPGPQGLPFIGTLLEYKRGLALYHLSQSRDSMCESDNISCSVTTLMSQTIFNVIFFAGDSLATILVS